MKKLIYIPLIILLGCSTKTATVQTVYLDVEENPIRGTVSEPWVEPMIDTVKIPAQLDPNGITYRPAHTSIVEIPQGRVQQVQYPVDK